MLKNTATQYGSVTKFFHWIIFFLVACIIPVGFLMGNIPEEATRDTVINYHKLTGLSILLLMLLRVSWTIWNPKPVVPNTPLWQQVLERIVHFSLYAALIIMPVSGWIGSVAAGYVPHALGVSFNLPVPQSKALDNACFAIHNTLAFVIIALVSLHILAAVYHHVVKKDKVLLRMMPGGDVPTTPPHSTT